MGFSAASKAVLLVQLSLFLLSSFTVFAQILPEALPPHYHGISPVIAPVNPPSHHHHHHHHHHSHPHPPTPTPTKPPTHPPVYPPPPKAPAVAPVYPPPKPPVHPPPKPPTYAPPKPPVHPPPKPPTYAPPKPPVHPPPKPPTYAPKPPVHPHPKPPTYAPPKPPVHPPTKPPTYSPPKPSVHPPTKPTQPPTKPPVHPPTYPPSHPAPKPPTYPKPPRSFVAVQGVVYCKSCKYAGSETLLGAKPIFGATVKLTCKNTKYKQEVTAKTDKNGYFYLQAPKTVTSYGAHKCTASLLSSPLTSCSKPSNLHLGLEGAPLRPEKPFTVNKLPFILYTVGPFAFEPKCY